MKTRASAIMLSSIGAVLAAWALDMARCAVAGCIQYDASIGASDVVGPIILFGYVTLSWLTVYPTALGLLRYVSAPAASALSAVSYAFVVACLLHRPGTGAPMLHTLGFLGPWLGISWFIGAFIATTLWPKPASETQRA